MYQHSQRHFFSAMPQKQFAALPVREVALSSGATKRLLAQTFESLSLNSYSLPPGTEPYTSAVIHDVNAKLDSLIADATILFERTGSAFEDFLNPREIFQAHCASTTTEQWLLVISKVDHYFTLLDGIFFSSDPTITGDLVESVLGNAAIEIARALPQECKRLHDRVIKHERSHKDWAAQRAQ